MDNAAAPTWPDVDATKDGSYYPRGRSPGPGQKDSDALAKLSRLVPKDSFRLAVQARDGYDDPTRNLQFPGARVIESATSSSESLHRSTPPTTQDEFEIQQPIPDPKSVNDLQSPNSPTFVTPSLDAEALLRSLSPTPASRQSPLPRVNSQEPLSPDTLPHKPRTPSPLPPLPPLDAVDEETSSPDSAEGQTMSPTRPQRIVRFKSRVRISLHGPCLYSPTSERIPESTKPRRENPYRIAEELEESTEWITVVATEKAKRRIWVADCKSGVGDSEAAA
ncbi:hypothetical protein FRB90_012085 [Tulasnella sp. 427]|nr:hypothetical protein FRB90_012085 [Tulasnella sp. 427]